MNAINRKYDLKIEVLTPLSIGAGAEKDWVRGVDFVVKNNCVYKLNLKKIVKEGVDLDMLTSYFVSKNEQGIVNLITEPKLEKVSDFVMQLPADSPNDIKAFVKNQLTGKPILAGSSLKGAIRSILFNYLRGNECDEKKVFGSSVEGDEFMRFIKISDAEFDSTSLVNTKIFNLQKNGNWIGGWKHGGKTDDKFKPNGFNTIYECLKPNQRGLASIMMSLSQFEKISCQHEEKKKDVLKKKKDVLSGDLTSLFTIVNEHTKAYLKKERDFFQNYFADKVDLIIESIDKLLSLIPTDNSYCILKMSAGSGFHSITGDWQFEDYSNGKFDRKRADKKDLKIGSKILPKSRKIAVWDNHFDLMGFVKLTALSEEDMRKEKEESEARARELAEKKRLLQEEQAKQEQEQREKEAQFEQFSKQAEDASSAEKWPEVLQHIECAEQIFPERSSRFDSLKNIANENIELQKQQKAIDEEKRKVEEERRSANRVPLAEKIAKISKIRTLCGNTKQWMNLNGLEQLSDEEQAVLKNKLLELYQSLKTKDRRSLNNFGEDLDYILGQDLAKQWFDEIVKK